MDPDKEQRDLQNQSPPISIGDISKLINEVELEKERILSEIPVEVHVSFFTVNCQDVIRLLCEKFDHKIKNLKMLIAGRARDATQALDNQFSSLEMTILAKPKNIEELTKIKDKIDQIPLDLIKLQKDIDGAINIYNILGDYQFKFGIGDLDRRWQMFGFPKRVEEVVEQRGEELIKE